MATLKLLQQPATETHPQRANGVSIDSRFFIFYFFLAVWHYRRTSVLYPLHLVMSMTWIGSVGGLCAVTIGRARPTDDSDERRKRGERTLRSGHRVTSTRRVP